MTAEAGFCKLPDMVDRHYSGERQAGVNYNFGYDAGRPCFGAALNEPKSREDRDLPARAPWHKAVPARLERINTNH